MSITYSELKEEDFTSWLALGQKLWTDYKPSELEEELRHLMRSPDQYTIIAKNDTLEAVGFINLSIRNDYVEGAEHSPTGYLEGIYVEKQYRKQGIAKKLLLTGEQWLKLNHCKQIGADTWLSNKSAQKFHEQVGFTEEERLVHYLKELE